MKLSDFRDDCQYSMVEIVSFPLAKVPEFLGKCFDSC